MESSKRACSNDASYVAKLHREEKGQRHRNSDHDGFTIDFSFTFLPSHINTYFFEQKAVVKEASACAIKPIRTA